MHHPLLFYTAVFLAPCVIAGPRDRALILSGGDNPFGNHHSQYLQTRLLTEHLSSRLSRKQVDVFFGAGNSESTRDLFPDVHQSITSSGIENVDRLFPGIITGNRIAEKSQVMAFLEQELPSKQPAEGNLFLFVTDHGMPNRDANGKIDTTYSNNCINLWSKNTRDLSNGEFQDSCLSVRDLKEKIESLPAKLTVFAMTQCYSGGFHALSVGKDPAGYWTANPKVCGFTAVTEDTTASGCTSNVDGPGYQGYERHFAEALSGIDVVSGRTLGAPARTIQEAHYRAAEVDLTKDIPLSTSEYFLRKWANQIDSSDFTPRTRTMTGPAARARFTLVAENETSREEILSRAGEFQDWFRMQFDHLDRMSKKLIESSPAFKFACHEPTSRILEINSSLWEAIECKSDELAELDQKSESLLDEVVRPKYIESQYEELKQHGFPQDPAKRWQLFLAISWEKWQDRLIELSREGSVMAATLAEQKQLKAKIRYDFIRSLENGKYAGVVDQLEKIEADAARLDREQSLMEQDYGLLRRLIIKRRVLAAAYALILMKDKMALSDLRGLLECESTAF